MSVPDFLFHRESLDVFEIDFDRFLGVSDIISTIDEVRVQRLERNGEWTDLTAKFVGVANNVVMAGSRAVQVTLGDGSTPADIAQGMYHLFVMVSTAQGRSIPTVNLIDVRAEAIA